MCPRVTSQSPPLRVLSIDYGKARAGIAVSDELGLFAHPRPALDAHNRNALIAALIEIIQGEGIQKIIVGLPVEMDGGHGPAARRALAFAQALADKTGMDIELFDERLSTAEAQRKLSAAGTDPRKQKSKIDGAAACVLLQSFLDRHAQHSPLQKPASQGKMRAK